MLEWLAECVDKLRPKATSFFHAGSVQAKLRATRKLSGNYEAPANTEIHTAYPVGKDRVLLMQNGNPARLLLIGKATEKVERELILQTARPENVHAQFRHIRTTKAETFLVAHLDLGKVVEYNADGNEIWSVPAPSAWAAVQYTHQRKSAWLCARSEHQRGDRLGD